MEDPLLSAMHHETDLEVAQRAYDFMLWIRNRTEKELLGSSNLEALNEKTPLGMRKKDGPNLKITEKENHLKPIYMFKAHVNFPVTKPATFRKRMLRRFEDFDREANHWIFRALRICFEVPIHGHAF